MDNNNLFYTTACTIRRISLQTLHQLKGLAVLAAVNLLYISYGSEVNKRNISPDL